MCSQEAHFFTYKNRVLSEVDQANLAVSCIAFLWIVASQRFGCWRKTLKLKADTIQWHLHFTLWFPLSGKKCQLSTDPSWLIATLWLIMNIESNALANDTQGGARKANLAFLSKLAPHLVTPWK